MKIKFTIPLAPVTKKNSQRILRNGRTGKPFVAPSKAYTEYAKAAVLYLRPCPERPIGDRVNVKCVFYMPTRRRVDLVNLLEAADDVLVAAGVIEDDHSGIIAAHDGSRVQHDKARPRTEIEIAEMNEDDKP